MNISQCYFRTWIVFSWTSTISFQCICRIKLFTLYINVVQNWEHSLQNGFGMHTNLTNRKALCRCLRQVRNCDVTSFTWCYTWRHAISLEHCTRRRKLQSSSISYWRELTTGRSKACYQSNVNFYIDKSNQKHWRRVWESSDWTEPYGHREEKLRREKKVTVSTCRNGDKRYRRRIECGQKCGNMEDQKIDQESWSC